jgi:hypothetical protein
MAEQMRLQTPTQQTATGDRGAVMKTGDMMRMLYAHYGQQRNALGLDGVVTEGDLLIEEVPAPGTERRLDLLRIGMWPSRGQHIIGHEVKVSRSDWLRELKEPAKADAWWAHLHEFWVAAPTGIVRPDELPDGWGLMTPPTRARGRRFRVVVQAARKTPSLDPRLLVEVARRIDNSRLAQMRDIEQRHQAALRNAIAAERQRREDYQSPETQQRLRVLNRLETLLATRLSEFGYAAVGSALTTVTADEVAEAVAAYLAEHIDLQRLRRDLQRGQDELERTAERVLQGLRGREVR